MSTIKTDGERRAAEFIWEKCRRRMYSVAFSILKNRCDAEDAVMDAMARIISNIGKFAPLGENDINALTTVYVKNTALDIYRKNSTGTADDLDVCFDVSDITADVEVSVLTSDRVDRLCGFLSTLPYIYSHTFLLKYYFGYTDSEIAAAMKSDKNTVRKRLTRVRKMLRDNAEAKGFGDGETVGAAKNT